MLLISILIYLLFAFIGYNCFYKQVTLARLLIVFFVVVFASNVLIFEILSLLKIANQPLLFLILQILFCGLASFLLFRNRPFSLSIIRTNTSSFFKGFRRIDYVLLGFMGLIFTAFFIVGISTPPNNLDSLHTHLARIYYWFQHGSFAYWPTANSYQLIYPINGHIQGLWLFLLGHSENLFFLLQWFSLIVITASIYEISRSLGFATTQSLMSGIVGLSFPIALLQTYSFQGDLTVTALVMVFLSFMLSFINSREMKFFWPAALALILALGTKQTAFFVLPMTGLFALYWLIINKCFKKLLAGAGLLLVFLLAFASFQYVQNLTKTGSLFGVDEVLTEKYPSINYVAEKAQYVFPRYFYQFIGVDGLARANQPSLILIKETAFKRTLSPAGIDLERPVYLQPGFDSSERFEYATIPVLSEDTAWFGPLGFLLLPAALLVSLFSKEKPRRKYALFALLLCLTYSFFIFFQRAGWDPYQGRYFILAIFPILPLVSNLIPKQKFLKILALSIILPLGLLLSINTFIANDSKPVITAKTQNEFINQYVSPMPEETKFQVVIKKILLKISFPSPLAVSHLGIYQGQYIEQVFYSSQFTVKDLKFVNRLIPDGSPIYLMITRNPLEYGLFGRNKTRDLYPVTDAAEVSSGYLLALNQIKIPLSANIKLLGKNENYSIYFINPE